MSARATAQTGTAHSTTGTPRASSKRMYAGLRSALMGRDAAFSFQTGGKSFVQLMSLRGIDMLSERFCFLSCGHCSMLNTVMALPAQGMSLRARRELEHKRASGADSQSQLSQQHHHHQQQQQQPRQRLCMWEHLVGTARTVSGFEVLRALRTMVAGVGRDGDLVAKVLAVVLEEEHAGGLGRVLRDAVRKGGSLAEDFLMEVMRACEPTQTRSSPGYGQPQLIMSLVHTTEVILTWLENGGRAHSGWRKVMRQAFGAIISRHGQRQQEGGGEAMPDGDDADFDPEAIDRMIRQAALRSGSMYWVRRILAGEVPSEACGGDASGPAAAGAATGGGVQEAYPDDMPMPMRVGELRCAARGGNVQVFEWVESRAIRGLDTCLLFNAYQAMLETVQGGNLEMLKFLWGRSDFCVDTFMHGMTDIAARNGHLDVLEWMYTTDRLSTRASYQGLHWPAINGHLGCLRFLYDNQLASHCERNTIEMAVTKSRQHTFDVVEFLLDNDITNVTPEAIVAAALARNVRVDLLTFLARRATATTWHAATMSHTLRDQFAAQDRMREAKERADRW